MGGIINVTIKSGTNQFHGSAHEFFRNDKPNANSWTNNSEGLTRGITRWNNFGGTGGGPIKKDKIFSLPIIKAPGSTLLPARPGFPAKLESRLYPLGNSTLNEVPFDELSVSFPPICFASTSTIGKPTDSEFLQSNSGGNPTP